MDDTEITNNEYRQFVYYVRDSLAHARLDYFNEDDNGQQTIDWTEKIDWTDEALKICTIKVHINMLVLKNMILKSSCMSTNGEIGIKQLMKLNMAKEAIILRKTKLWYILIH